ncbi:MOSC domain-containing protein [Deinococcus xianganensis]|uniref:MOSC domain-containing protein n=1 Tax=Deinococcus xianganensis TaxID=1507289 RepID=A0A6I4YEZ5_9DEIO|nr:MOSC domain-containing protein [Deinococcus xianganensis]MXV18444.1 MOSC domain-containing protein [Deinococcus xianganensis]
MTIQQAQVIAVARDGTHRFSKAPQPGITLLAGLGVQGDAHAGDTVRHRSRVRADPTQPNLRQVHLIHAELLGQVAADGFHVQPADLGENITTRGLDLLALPRGTRLTFPSGATVEVTGLRNPCAQIDAFRPGLMRRLIGTDDAGAPVFLAGVMGVVLEGGEVTPGDPIRVTLPPEPHEPLRRV